MVLGQLDIQMPKNETQPLSRTIWKTVFETDCRAMCIKSEIITLGKYITEQSLWLWVR